MMPLSNDHLFQPLFVKGKWAQDQLRSTLPDTLALTELVYFALQVFKLQHVLEKVSEELSPAQ